MPLEELAAAEHLPANMYVYAENHWLAETPLLPEEETDEQSMAARFYGANRIFVTGTLPAYFAFSWAALKSGNFFVDDDVRNGNRVLIIPESLAEELFGQEDPLGKAVPLSDFGSEETLDYTVIGVLAAPDEKEGAMGTYQDPRQAYAPVAGSPYVSYDQGVMEFYNVYVGLEAGADLARQRKRWKASPPDLGRSSCSGALSLSLGIAEAITALRLADRNFSLCRTRYRSNQYPKFNARPCPEAYKVHWSFHGSGQFQADGFPAVHAGGVHSGDHRLDFRHLAVLRFS